MRGGGPARSKEDAQVHVELENPRGDSRLGEEGGLHEPGIAAPGDNGDDRR